MLMPTRAPGSRCVLAYSDPEHRLHCNAEAEGVLRWCWPEATAGEPLPPALRGLAESAQGGEAGTQWSLTVERLGQVLRIEANAVTRQFTHFQIWVGGPPEPAVLAAPSPDQALLPPPPSTHGPATAPAVDRDRPLTQREREVARLVIDGLRTREVAERLGVAEQTVKTHLKTIFDKFGVRNRVELAGRLRSV